MKPHKPHLERIILLVVCFVLLIYIILFCFWSRVPCIPPSLLSWAWLWTPDTRACPYLPSARIAGEHWYTQPLPPSPSCLTPTSLFHNSTSVTFQSHNTVWNLDQRALNWNCSRAFKLSKASCFSAMMVGYYPSIGVFVELKLGRESLAHTYILVCFLWQSWAYPSLSSACFGVNPNFMVVIQDFSSVRVFFFLTHEFTSLPTLTN